MEQPWPLRPQLGDMNAESFRRSEHSLVDWIAHYLDGGADSYPVLSRVRPGEIRASLASSAPAHGRPMSEILGDFERLLLQRTSIGFMPSQ